MFFVFYSFRNNAVDKSVVGEYSTTAYAKHVEGIVANHTATNSSQPLFMYLLFLSFSFLFWQFSFVFYFIYFFE